MADALFQQLRILDCRTRQKWAPKQLLNVAVGSLIPASVPPIFAVYPDRK